MVFHTPCCAAAAFVRASTHMPPRRDRMPKPKIRQVNSSITPRAGSWLYSQPYRKAPVLLPMPLLATGFSVWAVLLTSRLKLRPIISVMGVKISACALPPTKWNTATSKNGNCCMPTSAKERMRPLNTRKPSITMVLGCSTG